MSKLDGLQLNRLVVLLQVFAIPLYFFWFSLRWKESLQIFFDTMLTNAPWLSKVLPAPMVVFLVNFGIPIFFSFPWVLGTMLRATRIANAYSLMSRALGKVRIDQKLFYGLNAAFTLIFFILPFGSPLITIVGIFVVLKILMDKIKIGSLSKLTWFIPGLIVAFYPILIAVAFYLNYIVLVSSIIATWSIYTDIAFGIGLSLAIAISIGNFLLFLLEGRAKYENVSINYAFVIFFKMVLFGVFAMMYFFEGVHILNIINYIAVAFAFLEMLLRRRHNLNTEGNATRGLLMVIVFSLVNILIRYLNNFGNVIQSLVIIISGMIFFFLFIASYRYAEDEDLF